MRPQRDQLAHVTGKPARGRRVPWSGLMALAVVLVWTGCEDEVNPPSAAGPPRAAATRQNPRAQAATAEAATLQLYKKVEDFAADPEEAGQLRHVFSNRDFEPDITGDENRDPFRSYVIRQPGMGQPERGQQAASANPTEMCSSKNLVASNFPLRDLRLIGIVLRGTSSYALFRDSGSYGHIVRKGDCVGQEKARVAAIRAGFVSLEVMSEASAGQPGRAPQERAIQLYPEELAIEPSQ